MGYGRVSLLVAAPYGNNRRHEDIIDVIAIAIAIASESRSVVVV